MQVFDVINFQSLGNSSAPITKRPYLAHFERKNQPVNAHIAIYAALAWLVFRSNCAQIRHFTGFQLHPPELLRL